MFSDVRGQIGRLRSGQSVALGEHDKAVEARIGDLRRLLFEAAFMLVRNLSSSLSQSVKQRLHRIDGHHGPGRLRHAFYIEMVGPSRCFARNHYGKGWQSNSKCVS